MREELHTDRTQPTEYHTSSNLPLSSLYLACEYESSTANSSDTCRYSVVSLSLSARNPFFYDASTRDPDSFNSLLRLITVTIRYFGAPATHISAYWPRLRSF